MRPIAIPPANPMAVERSVPTVLTSSASSLVSVMKVFTIADG